MPLVIPPLAGQVLWQGKWGSEHDDVVLKLVAP